MTDREPDREPTIERSAEPAPDDTSAAHRPRVDSVERRAKFLRLALVVVGAGLAAAAFNLYDAGRVSGPVDAALTEAASATSGVVSIDIDVPTSDDVGRAHLTTEFSGDDYETTFTAAGDPAGTDGSNGPIQQVRSVDGTTFVRTVGTDTFLPGSATEIDLAAGVPAGAVIKASLFGWRGAGLEGLADGTEFEPVGGDRHRATVTVGDLRRLDPGIAALGSITDEASAFGDDDPVELTVDIVDGVASSLVARASGGTGPGEPGDRPSVTVTVTFADLGGSRSIDEPTGAGS